jgi:hypothetical protein
MVYAEASEEDLKKQRRQEQVAAARLCCGTTCEICGKACIVTAGIMATFYSCLICLVKCIPG